MSRWLTLSAAWSAPFTFYERDRMSLETRETFLQSQLQEDLRYDLMKSPVVSGAQMYKELCLAAKNEDKH